jgi:hypothetical protein
MAKRRSGAAAKPQPRTNPLSARRPRRAPDEAPSTLRCKFGNPVGPDGKAPGYTGPDHCAQCADQAEDDRRWAAAEHLARCRTCGIGVTFHPVSSDAFTVIATHGVPQETTFGIGPQGFPVCPDGHGEMALADEQLVPAHEAISRVAAKVNGSNQQQSQLFITAKPFNVDGAMEAIVEKNQDVCRARAEYEGAKSRAAAARKRLDEEASALGDLIGKLSAAMKDRARQIADQAEQALEAAEAEAATA